MTKPCDHPKDLKVLTRRVQACLTPDLLGKKYRSGGHGPYAGHCAVASEAIWAARARELGYKHRRGLTDEATPHIWLVSPEGCVLGPTASQFSPDHFQRIYARGKGVGPQGARYDAQGRLVPSARAREVLRRMEAQGGGRVAGVRRKKPRRR